MVQLILEYIESSVHELGRKDNVVIFGNSILHRGKTVRAIETMLRGDRRGYCGKIQIIILADYNNFSHKTFPLMQLSVEHYRRTSLPYCTHLVSIAEIFVQYVFRA